MSSPIVSQSLEKNIQKFVNRRKIAKDQKPQQCMDIQLRNSYHLKDPSKTLDTHAGFNDTVLLSSTDSPMTNLVFKRPFSSVITCKKKKRQERKAALN